MELLSKTKVDQLGDRLRKGNIADDDLRLLDEYRHSFADTYDTVVGAIRNQLTLEPTGRPAKSTTSITEKLRRESIRLTQVQDIAGCRIVVPEIAEQERVVKALVELLVQTTVVDRRQKPSHGYRAVHVVATIDKRAVEIQVRTALQQLWAEVSEKFADLYDLAIKYGGGKKRLRSFLDGASAEIGKQENWEFKSLKVQSEIERLLSAAMLTEADRAAIIKLQEEATSLRRGLVIERENTFNILQDVADMFQER